MQKGAPVMCAIEWPMTVATQHSINKPWPLGFGEQSDLSADRTYKVSISVTFGVVSTCLIIMQLTSPYLSLRTRLA